MTESEAGNVTGAGKREAGRVVAISATFTAEPVADTLELWARETALPFSVEFAPYDQVFQQLLDPASLLSANHSGLNVLLLRLEDWGLGAAGSEAQARADEFVRVLSAASPRSRVPYLVVLCPPSARIDEDPSARARHRELESRLEAALASSRNVHWLPASRLAAQYPVEGAVHQRAHGNVPYTPLFFAALGTAIARTLHALEAAPYKVIVLDCDQTLWSGVCGEDGPTGVSVDAPRRALQQFVLDQHAEGKLICLCSKNAEEDVFAVFDRNPDMLLRREHLTAWRVNWSPKSANLRSLAEQLKLGLDSFIFVDDSPLEVAEVTASCPEILGLTLPQDPTQAPGFLQHVWAFDQLTRTAEDEARSEFYRQDAARERLRREALTFTRFLESLNLEARFFAPQPSQLGRVAQLTQRTNQFNCSTIRRTEPEIAQLLESGELECLAVEVRDRFGDYGLVGSAFFATRGSALRVDTLLLSCRALGRGVEHRILARLGEIASERGLPTVEVPFAPTSRNEPALRFLTAVAAAPALAGNGPRVFSLPATQASRVEFDPDSSLPPPAEEPAEAAPPVAATQRGLRIEGTRLGRIAAELRTPGQILARVTSERLRPRPSLGHEYVAPRTGLQATLCRLWTETLGVDRVGTSDDFFELGGTSLQATIFVNRAQDELGLSFGSIVVFEAPTVAGLAEMLEKGSEQGPHAIRRLASADGAERTGPLSFAQQRLWFLDQFNPGSVVYNERRAIRLRGSLQVGPLERALDAVVARQESLRTTFPVVEGRVQQQVAPPRPCGLGVTDLGRLPKQDREASAIRFVAEEAARPFDLATGPLLRAGLLRLAPDDHVLWLVFHHIVADGWSVGILLDELGAHYRAELDGEPPALSRLSVQYLDFAAWQREPARGAGLDKELSYWRTRLASVPVVELPADHARQPILTYRGGSEPVHVRAELVERLRALGSRERATLFMTLMAAFQVLLARHSGQTDITIGFPIANRQRREIEGLVGFFVNTLALRSDLSGNPAFTKILRRIREGALEAYSHQDVPFEKLVDELVPQRDLARTPLFQVMLAVLEDPMTRLSLPGLRTSTLPVPVGTARFDLLLNLEENETGLVGGLEYSTDLFEPATARRLVGHYLTLLEGIVSDPSRPVLELPMLTEAERGQALVEWSGAGRRYEATSIVSAFAAQVARTPEAVAVVFEGETLTYGELDRRSNRLARRLQGLGVKPDTLVGLCLERSKEMVVAILGILKAGGAYLPLDPAYPAERLRMLIEDSAAPVVVTLHRHADPLTVPGARVICLDKEASEIEVESDGPVENGVRPEHLAYVIYTSGSTGKPKGVQITHANVTRLFTATEEWYGFGPTDVWTLFHSFAFDFSVWEIWGALLYGGRLVVVPYWVSRSPEAFHELLRREKVTVLNQTPSAFRQLIQADLAAAADVAEMALRYVIFGGEALELQSLRPWFDRYGDERPRLVNMYGITETTVHVTYRPIRRSDVESGAGSVIGIPIPDLQLYLLNEVRQPVPIGVAGEMYVGGAGVARGYLNRPELTRERFIADPFASEEGARLYRSGDLARRLANGDLEYMGRIDDQVKIRGFRIELGEIESVISQHPAVRETVVLAREDVPGDRRLVAYVATDAEPGRIVEELRSLTRAKLPEYMVPAHFVWLASLPLTPNGKVDRRVLPAPDLGRHDSTRAYVAPATPAEEILAGIWVQVLHVARVGRDDNFFELGGDSILSIQVIAQARKAGLHLTPRDLFQRPTIAGLADGLGSRTATTADGDVPAGALPLTPVQRWFFEQELPDAHHWNQSFLFEVPADVDVDRLETALREVVLHHDALRLRFTRHADGWRQEYGTEPPATSITRVDLSAVADAEQEEAITTRATALQARLNPGEGRLVRAAHFDLGAGRPGRLLLIVHHLAVDGVSWRILLEDVDTAYANLQAGKPASLPAKTTSFKRWSEKLASYASSGGVSLGSRDHWLAVAGGSTEGLPLDHASAANLESSARTVSARLEVEETQALLQRVLASQRAQINDVLLTSLARGLQTWTARDSFVVEIEGHGREDIFEGIDLSRTVGWFTTIFPVRLELPPSRDAAASLRFVKQQLRGVPDRGLSYGVLRYLGEPPVRAALGKPRQIDLIFNYLGQLDQLVAGTSLLRFAPESTGPWHAQSAPRRHALEVMSYVQNGSLEVRFIYSEALHRRETIERLAESFVRGLRELVRQSGASASASFVPADFPLARLDQPALDRLLAEHPHLEDVYPLSPMQRLFHSVETSGSGLEQWRFSIRGALDSARLRRAWEAVWARHPVLRTAFVSEGLAEPLQVVEREVPIEWREEDLRELAEAGQDARLRSLEEAEAKRGFDLSRAPLTRVTLVRVANERHELLWTTHHLCIDGWSWPVVFSELSSCYESLREEKAHELAPPCPYSTFIRWLASDAPASESFWKTELLGFKEPTPIDLSDSAPQGATAPESGDASASVTGDAHDRLQALARRLQVTPSCVVQAAWAMTLGHYSAASDVAFGAAYSGRPPEIPGVEGLVGPCVNNVPVRVSLAPGQSVAALLAALQRKQADLMHHQHAPLAQIQEWAGVPLRLRLFESLLVFQNYAVGADARRFGDAEVRLVRGPDATGYRVTLIAIPGPGELRLKLLYQKNGLASDQGKTMLTDLLTVLEAMSASTEQTTEAVLAQLPGSTRGLAAQVAANRRHARASAYVAPSGDTERALAAIWSELFEVERVGLDDNFFDLGGNSLLLVRAHRELQKRLGTDLPITALFQYPTLRSLARHLSSNGGAEASSDELRERSRRRKEALARIKGAAAKR